MNDIRKFRKKVENFTCGNCGFSVIGNGYTNHCPKCLFSKHVDINPGDRASDCGGMMQPVAIEYERAEYILTHKCVTCGHAKRNKVQASDDPDAVVAFAELCAKRLSSNQ
jgi:hypothetical protein